MFSSTSVYLLNSDDSSRCWAIQIFKFPSSSSPQFSAEDLRQESTRAYSNKGVDGASKVLTSARRLQAWQGDLRLRESSTLAWNGYSNDEGKHGQSRASLRRTESIILLSDGAVCRIPSLQYASLVYGAVAIGGHAVHWLACSQILLYRLINIMMRRRSTQACHQNLTFHALPQ